MNEYHIHSSQNASQDPQETELLKAIAADPDSSPLRLIYADWLEERDDPRCEYLRLECQFQELIARTRQQADTKESVSRLARLRRRLSELLTGPRTTEQRLPGPVKAQLQSLRERMTELREECESPWLAAVSRSGVSCCEKTADFRFECPLKWTDLTPTADPYVKHCAACESPVYFEIDLSMAQERASEGKCVCVPADMTSRPPLQQLYDLAVGPFLMGDIEIVDCSENS